MPLAHPAISSSSATCSSGQGTNLNDLTDTMSLAHPPPKLQPAFLAQINLNLSYPDPRHLLMKQSHPPANPQPALLAQDPTLTILSTPMPLVHPTI